MRKFLFIIAALAAGILLWSLFRSVWGYPETRLLPYYTLRTMLRLSITYLICLFFGLAVGILAATRERVGNLLIPLLDIAQSVPVLGFFPLALAVIIRTFSEGTLGLELASMFLLFTSMEWSIVFGVIAGVKALPSNIRDMSRVFHIEGWDYLKHILLPCIYPYIVAGSILAWGSGWYFVIVTEYISFGDKVYSLPGLGYYLNVASFKYGSVLMSLAGLVIIGGLVFLMNRLIWHKLNERAKEFQFLALHGFTPRESNEENFWTRGVKFISSKLDAIHGVHTPPWFLFLFYRTKRNYLIIALILVAVIGMGIFYGWLKLPVSPLVAEDIAIATAYSLYRLTVAYSISVIIAVSLGFLMLQRPSTRNFLRTIADVMQSIPALAYFPLLWLVLTRIFPERIGLELAAILLMLSGMLWYLIFNVIEVVDHWPYEVNDISGLFSIRGLKFLRHILIPALFPALVTGSVLAWGGGWNATIVSEYVNIGHTVHTIPGLGSSLDIASNKGDTHQLLVLLSVMGWIVIMLNQFVWRRLLSRTSAYVLE